MDGPPRRRYFAARVCAAASAAARSAGSGARRSSSSPVTGWRKESRPACRNWRASAVADRSAVGDVAHHRMADRRHVDADLMGAAGVEHDPQQCLAAQQLDDLEVRAGLPAAAADDRHQRAVVGIAADRRLDRAGPRAPGCRRRARGTHGAARAPRAAPSAAGAPPRPRATTSRPEVSRSSRWTIPARTGSSPPAARPASAWARVPVRCPRAGCTTTPAGLSTTSRCSSSKTILERHLRRRPGRPARAPAVADLDHLAAADSWRLASRAPVDEHRARLDRRLGAGPGAERFGEEPIEPLARRAAPGTVSRSASGSGVAHRRRPPAPTAAPARRT